MPVVDDPRYYGRISAANSLSDVYAMGGTPILALNVTGYPATGLPPRVVAEILIGAGEKVKEADVVLVGGHTMDQTAVFFGLAVIGQIHPDKIYTNSNAKEGDKLILTKPLGSGILSTALNNNVLEERDYMPLLETMARLNKYASEQAVKFNTHSITDVTGFGFLGHLSEMLAASNKSAKIYTDAVPLFENVFSYIKLKQVPGGSKRNRSYAEEHVRSLNDFSDDMLAVLFDAQTSGGLIISVADEDADALLAAIREAGDTQAEIVGEVLPAQDVLILLE